MTAFRDGGQETTNMSDAANTVASSSATAATPGGGASSPTGGLHDGSPLAVQWLLWRRFTWRHWRRAPRSTALLIAILALGVGMVLAIRLANRAAVSGFRIFTDTVTGESDFVLVPPSGRMPDTVLGDLRRGLAGEPVQLFPVVEVSAADADVPVDGAPESFTILGVDLIALQNLAYSKDFARQGGWLTRRDDTGMRLQKRDSIWDFLRDPGAAFVSPALASRRGLALGDSLPLGVGDRRIVVTVAGFLPGGDATDDFAPPTDILIMDIAALRQLVGMGEQVNRVEVRLLDGAHLDPVRHRVQAKLEALAVAPDGNAAPRWSVETPQSRRATGEAMTAAFRMNLTVLSLLALVVGIYLILQALEGAVVKRRGEIAILRSLGVAAGAIQRAWFIEAVALGVVGSVVGVAVGTLGAQLAVQAVARTVNAIYYHNTVTAAAWRWDEVGLAMLLGVGAAALAGWLPANDAATTPPAQLLARGGHSQGPAIFRQLRWGVVFSLAGLVLYHLPPLHLAGNVRFPLAGHLAGFMWIVAGTSLAGVLFQPLAALGVRLGRGWPALRYAASQLRRATGRHYLTLAGLVLAIGMATGMAILIFSFESTIQVWINSILKADLYVASQYANGPGSNSRISAATRLAVLADPAVRDADIFQVVPITFRGSPTALAGSRFVAGAGGRDMVWIETPDFGPDLAGHGLAAEESVASESFSVRYDVHRGDLVDVPTPNGSRQVRVVGIFADYGYERGTLVVGIEHLWRWYADDQVASMSLYLRPGVDPEAARQRLLRAHPGLTIRSNPALRREIFRLFRQTFSITYVLQGVAVVVAVAGLGLALASLMLERRAELRTLKELGMSRVDIAHAAALEGAALAGVGLVGGLLQSLALAWLLIYVVNRQSFGWTLGWAVPWGAIAIFGGVVLAFGASVAWLVGYHGAKLPVEQEA